MRRSNDLTGHRFHRLVVLGRAEPTPGNRGARWRCKCDCGAETISRSDALKNGRSKSCGCHRAEMGGKHVVSMNTTHGSYGTPEYRVWRGMKDRCFNPNSASYADYGGRGITVCDKWVNSFQAFLADMGPRPDGASIDRIDNNKGYESGNCRWADRITQARNKRNNSLIEHEGETRTLSEWAERAGMPAWKLSQRLYRDNLQFSEAVINGDRRKGAVQ